MRASHRGDPEIPLIAVALAAFAWIAGSGVAGAAGKSGGGSNTGGRFQPVQQSEGETAPADRAAPDGDRDGHPCPDEEGGSGSGSGHARWRSKPSVETTRRSAVMHIAS